jgi:hypothetical protein
MITQFRFHFVEDVDVGELELQRALASEAHRKQREAVAGQTIVFMSLIAGFWKGVIPLRKIA